MSLLAQAIVHQLSQFTDDNKELKVQIRYLTMPLKPSRKSKKSSQIEDNNELRLSLMQRSILLLQPLPLVPLTNMSLPPPPLFEIQDLSSRSSGSGRGSLATATATAFVADIATASTVASTTASNTSTGTSISRNIHCKDLDLNVSGALASKKRRGLLIDAKTQQIVKVDGKIVVEYSDEHKGPANEAIHSLISHDIGSCVRDRVPMLAKTYAELPKKRGGKRVSTSKSILAENIKSQGERIKSQGEHIKSQGEQLQALNERIRQLEKQYADIYEIVRQFKETREAATGSNTSQR
ncbi:hypothetical protein LguiA_033905 [Lonicera macranthoides]